MNDQIFLENYLDPIAKIWSIRPQLDHGYQRTDCFTCRLEKVKINNSGTLQCKSRKNKRTMAF